MLLKSPPQPCCKGYRNGAGWDLTAPGSSPDLRTERCLRSPGGPWHLCTSGRPQPEQGWMPQADGKTAARSSRACLDVSAGSWRGGDGCPGGNSSSGSTGQDPYTDASLQMGGHREEGCACPGAALYSTPPEQLSVS